MNKHVEFDFDVVAKRGKPLTANLDAVGPDISEHAPRRRWFSPDLKARIIRYAALSLLALAAIWGPIAGYILYAPKTWTSGAMLILPGAGSSASVNLSDIGQASSAAASPFSSSAVSPTVTYKSLLASTRVLAAAAGSLGIAAADHPRPRVKLTDQTSIIGFEVTSGSPEQSAAAAEAILAAFLAELSALRSDEIARREAGFRIAVGDYQASVDRTRAKITALKEASGLLSTEQFERMVEEADSLEIRVRDIEASLAHRRRAMAGLTSALSLTPEQAARFLQLRADPEFQVLVDAMAAKSAEAAAARAAYGVNHPIRIEIETALKGARGKAYARAAEITGVPVAEVGRRVDFSGASERGGLMAEMIRVKTECDGMEAELANLQAELSVTQAKVRSLVEAASALDDLGRDYQVAEAVFTSALARTDTAKTDIFASYPLVQVLEPPSVPFEPSSPHILLALAAGVAATLLFCFSLVLAWIRRPLINRLIARPAR